VIVKEGLSIRIREVEHRISNPSDVNSIPTMATMSFTLLFFYFFIGKIFKNFWKTSGNLRKTSKTAENYGNANEFTRGGTT
jgi:hypothetical protein